MSLKGKLSRFKHHLALEEPKRNESKQFCKDIPFLKKWEKLNGKPYVSDDQYIIVRELSYNAYTKYGHYTFSKLEQIIEAWNKKQFNHPLSAQGRKSSDFFFFDTETTGLSHGTGNMIFLLGMSQLNGDEVKVTQYFLPGPGHEVALYERFLNDVSDFDHMVTFNGRSFDWPQVKSRHTLLRDLVPDLPAFGHFDLLHGSRRLWKDALGSTKLSIVESEILGLNRAEDTPGFLAPMMYFSFLQEKDPEIMEGLLQHNVYDVLTLMVLYIHISRQLLDLSSNISPKETYEVARWYEALKQDDLSVHFYTKVLNGDNRLQLEAAKALARLYKKHKRIKEAKNLWLDCIKKDERDINSCIELAKLFEHIDKDYESALHYATLAFERVKDRTRILKNQEKKEKEECLKRIERLKGKCGISL